jgi:predicted phosphodiesterase
LRRAIISDIHANLVALEAVLSELERQEVDSIYCLGDVIGYGPQPRECLAKSRSFELNLLGNHEEAVLYEPIGFNARAKSAVDWTKDQLRVAELTQDEKREIWNFLGDMPARHVEGDVLYVHGSPRDPTREYVFVSDIRNPAKITEIFEAQEQRTSFAGHTHTAGVFTEDCEFLHPSQIGNRYQVGERKVLINVGSVGQPRDGDPRGSYVIFDGEIVEFHRVKYDVEEAIRRFRETPLPEELALRLIEGR